MSVTHRPAATGLPDRRIACHAGTQISPFGTPHEPTRDLALSAPNGGSARVLLDHPLTYGDTVQPT
jgi:hypothetical protein